MQEEEQVRGDGEKRGGGEGRGGGGGVSAEEAEKMKNDVFDGEALSNRRCSIAGSSFFFFFLIYIFC